MTSEDRRLLYNSAFALVRKPMLKNADFRIACLQC
jgi:hypothetical protein